MVKCVCKNGQLRNKEQLEKDRQRSKGYCRSHKEEKAKYNAARKEQRRKRANERRKTDHVFRVSHNITNRFYTALK